MRPLEVGGGAAPSSDVVADGVLLGTGSPVARATVARVQMHVDSPDLSCRVGERPLEVGGGASPSSDVVVDRVPLVTGSPSCFLLHAPCGLGAACFGSRNYMPTVAKTQTAYFGIEIRLHMFCKREADGRSCGCDRAS